MARPQTKAASRVRVHLRARSRRTACILLAVTGIVRPLPRPTPTARSSFLCPLARAGRRTWPHALSATICHRTSAPSWSRTVPAPAARLCPKSVATSTPDGYTLMLATSGSLSISAQLYKNAGYDPVSSFAPIALAFDRAAGGGRQFGNSRPFRRRADRLCQGQSGQAQLWRDDRHAAAHVRRNVQGHYRQQDRIRTLQDRLASFERCARRGRFK